MMSDPLTDLINDVQNNGIRWVTLVTLYSLYRKERRNTLLNKRDEANFHNQREVMNALGVGEKWKDGPNLGLNLKGLPIFGRLCLLLRKATKHQKRRMMKMNLLKNPWSKKLFAFLLLVLVNGMNDTLGLNLSHNTVNQITGIGQIYIVSQAAVDMVKPLILMILGSFNKAGVVAVVKPTDNGSDQFN